MKVFIFLVLLCTTARAQSDSTNPYNIAQPRTIILHHTDVYYNPFAPPPDTTVREALCNLANTLTDSNGIEEPGRTPSYRPTIDTFRFGEWHPHGTQIGWNTTWQRLFTARRQADGTLSDIIAGSTGTHDSVIVSRNEDVDFRASGRIWLRSGFHVMPGAFFHAYTEPKWGSAVLSDDFNGTHIDTTQWYVMNGHEGGGHNECSFDTNAFITIDADAIDGKALDIVMREDTDCRCVKLVANRYDDTCRGILDPDTSHVYRAFSSAIIYACPWPYADRTGKGPLSMAYQHMPYGKYEVREKIPHFLHHTNNWLWMSANYEIDMNEGYPGWQGQTVLIPSLHHRVPHGPYTGYFHTTPTDTEFISGDAHWCESNVPRAIIIDGFAYNVKMIDSARVVNDGDPLAWPASLRGSSEPRTFYYTRDEGGTADNLEWRIKPDHFGKWRIFAAPYHIRHMGGSDSVQRFSKDFQPSQVTLTLNGAGDQLRFDCFWDSSINYPVDSGFLYLRDPNGLDTSLYWTSNPEPFTFNGIREGISDYPGPAFEVDWGDSVTSKYRYHTMGLEVLPNEIRILWDSSVVRRIPDRLVPQNNRMFDVTSHLSRSGGNFMLGEFDLDNATDGSGHLRDLNGTDTTRDGEGNFTSITHAERVSFEKAAAFTVAHPSTPWAGFDIYHGQPAAHHMVDYVRVWDAPSSITIPNFPN